MSGSRSTMFRLIATYFAGDEECTASMASHFSINISKYLDAVIDRSLFAALQQLRCFHPIRPLRKCRRRTAPAQRLDFLKERRIGAQRRKFLEEQREIALFAENG